jgi:hypothetical protein
VIVGENVVVVVEMMKMKRKVGEAVPQKESD